MKKINARLLKQIRIATAKSGAKLAIGGGDKKNKPWAVSLATTPGYDPDKDSHDSWRLGIDELRKKGLREGRFKPVNDSERAYVADQKVTS